MSENCNLSCSSCSEDCEDREEKQHDLSAQLNEMSRVQKVIGVVSGKGGVGKSLVTSLLAVTMRRLGYRTAILDADITGPSIPKTFGVREKSMGNQLGILPVQTKTGIDLMSINLLLDNDTDPVVWRGPVIANAVKQFWTEVIWGDVDYMFIDMPPGTGDVPLTVFQSIPVDGIIIVTSPQELVSMIVSKAVKMAEMMKVPIIGLVENMSYFRCPDNGKDYQVFGDSHIEEIAEAHELDVLAKIPIDPQIATACDKGMIEDLNGHWMDTIAILLEKMKENDMKKIAVASEKGMVAGHFGHCEGFTIFDTEGDQITGSTTVANPGHRPGFLPNFLNDQGVNVIISGGMGAGAINIFSEKGIEVIVGATGDAKEAVESYLQGTLESTGSVCDQHEHHGECGGH